MKRKLFFLVLFITAAPLSSTLGEWSLSAAATPLQETWETSLKRETSIMPPLTRITLNYHPPQWF